MLHIGVLPRHDLWGDFLHNLRFVVVDEAHVYRGVFGSHVANVLRRLRRLARIYGAEPQFLLASATIANAGELALALTGEEATVVEDDAAPRAERTVALWNPPLLDAELGLRASALGEASRLLAALVGRGLRTICFAKSRKSAELVHRFASRPARRADRGTARALPRRLHAAAAPRDRAAARRGRAARRRGDRRARARDRHRRARLRDLGRLPGHGREPAPAVGTRRPPRARPRDPRRLGGRARPVLHARAAGAARAARRGGDPRPREPARARRPRRRGRVRGSARRGRRRDARRRRRSSGRRTSRSCATRRAAGSGPARTRRPPRISLRSTSPDAFLVVDASSGDVARPGRARARLLDGPRGRGLPPPRPPVPRARARPRRRGARSSSRSTATGTRRRRRRRRRRSRSRCASSAGSGSSSPSAASR